jgi:hypothetical protein
MSFAADPFLTILVVIGASSLLKMSCLFLRKEYRYYFAKGSFILTTKTDEDKKMKYLDLMLDSYNKYLQRTIKVRIKEIDKYISK